MDDFDSVSSEYSPDESLTWRSDLLRCLRSIQTTGDFSWTDSYHIFVNPALDIPGHGKVALPLCPRVAHEIKQACRLAPFGNGHQTVVDDSVRKTWQLHHTQFRLANPHWQAFLESGILAPAAQRLGLVGAQAKPHKLLLYEPGSFFKQHKDSQKEPGMVGTLVVCLPSEHDGGEVHLSFKEENRTYATGPGSEFDMTAMAWFGDVSHEVKELRSGYRLVLTYNIVVPTVEGPKSAAFFNTQVEKLQRILIDWRETDQFNCQVYYPLDHQYSESSLSLGNLKGRDDVVRQVLQLAASKIGFSIFLASMTHNKECQEGYDESDESEEWTVLDNMYTPQGKLIAREIGVHTDEILCSQPFYGDDMAADSEDEPEYLGNEHAAARFRYHDSVLVIWAKNKLDSLLGLDRDGLLVDALVSEVLHDLENHQDGDQSVAYATSFIKACCESARHKPASTLPRILDCALAVNSSALYEAALKAGCHLAHVQKTLARHIEQDFSRRAEPGDFENEEWSKWLGVVVKKDMSLTSLQSILHGLAFHFSARLKPSFRSWEEATLETQLKTKPQLDLGDHEFIMKLIQAHHADIEWLSTRVLSELCARGNKALLRRVLDTVFELREREFTPDEAKAIYRHILGNSIKVFSVRITEFGVGCYSSSAFTSLVDRSLGLGLSDTLCPIFEESRRGFQAAELPHEAEYGIANFLRDLVKVVQKNDQSVTPQSSSVLAAFFETVLTRFFFDPAPSAPTERFKGWASPAQGCGDAACSACKELDEFLLSEDRTTFRFTLSYNQVWHVRERVKKDGQVRFETEVDESGVGDRQVLVIHKVRTMLQMDVSLYESKIQALERQMEPLQGEWMRKLLGDVLYGKLVLLEGVRQDAQGDGRGPLRRV
ncbi:hypothetical protein A9K55_009334 [Cordyceps militaris]|uniref:Uncharacterized protein n=1 Tax=Cordyceps militaris TaxID=73501 RepID=A0A2H4SJ12_CORMI|nr:hypothetical protein A9K55_009334 [Cordyceps militaris]